MAQRYVRVKISQGQTYYGLLQPDRSTQILDAPPWLGGQPTELQFAANEYQLLAPCAPSKIVAVGRNYPSHAAEVGATPPQEPLIFLKPPTSAIGDNQAICLPPRAKRVDYEGELALVVGERASDCSPEAARSKIWGYTIANDVTARDLQRQDGQWTRAKGYDTFCPLGPWIVRDLGAAAKIQTFLNNEDAPRQESTIDAMRFAPEEIVSYISSIMTLLPGDIILTGTPAGIGPLQAGDRVRVAIEGIGQLENPVAARPQPLAEDGTALEAPVY